MTYGAFPSPRKQLEGALVQRAWADADFKALLLRDPRQAIEDEFGIELPKRMVVEVIEERPDRLVIVVPVNSSGFLPPSVNAMIGLPSVVTRPAPSRLPMGEPNNG